MLVGVPEGEHLRCLCDAIRSSAVVDPTAYSGMFINYGYSEDIDSRDGGVAIASNY